MQALRDLLEFYLLAPTLVGGDPKQAETVARQIASIDAAEGFLAAARIAEFHKDRTRMEAMLQAAAAVRPPSYKALMAMAQFLSRAGAPQRVGGRSIGREAPGARQRAHEAYCVLAVALCRAWELGRTGSQSCPSAAHAVPDDAAPYYRAAEQILSDGREPARAERYLRLYLAQEAEGNQPAAADAHWQLGLALRAQGQEANAIREWKIASQLDPESPAVRELKQTRSANVGDPRARGGANEACRDDSAWIFPTSSAVSAVIG